MNAVRLTVTAEPGDPVELARHPLETGTLIKALPACWSDTPQRRGDAELSARPDPGPQTAQEAGPPPGCDQSPTAADERRCPPKTLALSDLRAAQIQLGRGIGTLVDQWWQAHGRGPTWSETTRQAAARGIFNEHLGAAVLHRDAMRRVIHYLCGTQWLAATQEHRSLCTGPAYHADRHGRRTQRSDIFGWRVACAIGSYRHRHNGRNPTWEQLVAQDRSKNRLFVDITDAHAQSRWLIATQWVRVEDGGLRRGQAARDASRARRQHNRRHARVENTTETGI